jgi:hypothetical protein
MKLVLNGIDIPGTTGCMYNRDTDAGCSTATVPLILDLNSGDKIKMQAVKISVNGNSTARLLLEGSGLTIKNC